MEESCPSNRPQVLSQDQAPTQGIAIHQRLLEVIWIKGCVGLSRGADVALSFRYVILVMETNYFIALTFQIYLHRFQSGIRPSRKALTLDLNFESGVFRWVSNQCLDTAVTDGTMLLGYTDAVSAVSCAPQARGSRQTSAASSVSACFAMATNKSQGWTLVKRNKEYAGLRSCIDALLMHCNHLAVQKELFNNIYYRIIPICYVAMSSREPPYDVKLLLSS
ncbi:hypothetical protein Tco_0602592 [Tanacetum coccineum]